MAAQVRAEQGLGCRVCGVVFSTVSSRILLLKHIQKTGHTTDPTPRLLTTINKRESVMVDTRIFSIYQIVILECRHLLTSQLTAS